MGKSMDAQEIKWRAEDDARTLAEYNEIMSDKARRTHAIKAAKSKATELEKKATAMKAVVRKGGKK